MKIKSNVLTLEDKIAQYFEVICLINNISIKAFDLKILAKIYTKNAELSQTIIDIEQRNLILFSKKTKEDIAKVLNIKYTVFNNSLSVLRKLNFIGDNVITLTIDFAKETNITILYGNNS